MRLMGTRSTQRSMRPDGLLPFEYRLEPVGFVTRCFARLLSGVPWPTGLLNGFQSAADRRRVAVLRLR